MGYIVLAIYGLAAAGLYHLWRWAKVNEWFVGHDHRQMGRTFQERVMAGETIRAPGKYKTREPWEDQPARHP